MERELTLSNHLEIIEEYARVCYKKIKKPSIMDVQDLVNEGIITFLNARDKFDKSRSDNFKPLLKKSLRNRFGVIVCKSYKSVNYTALEGFHKSKLSSIQTLLDFNEQLNTLEKEYLLLLLKPPIPVTELIESNVGKVKQIIRQLLGISSKKGVEIERNIRILLKQPI